MEQFRLNKLRVLVFVKYYLPGYKSGGPIKTVSNLVSRLGDEICFNIVTSDRDFGDSKPYYNNFEKWRTVGKAMVCYLSHQQQRLSFISKILSETEYDILYLNSMFAPVFTIYPLIAHKIGPKRKLPVIIASRGEASPKALELKGYKKIPFVILAKTIGLYDSIKWHASSKHEYEQIHALFDTSRTLAKVMHVPNVAIAPDLTMQHEDFQLMRLTADACEKNSGSLRIVFLSRITRMKNLDGAIKILQGVSGNIELDIYGPVDDHGYWSECEQLIRLLPSNIKVSYKGSVDSKDVMNVLSKYNLFFLPTLGENFGHAILEALTAGCPVLISDRTPWRDLEKKGVGWDISLEKPDRFQSVLRQCVQMDRKLFFKMSRQAMNFGSEVANNDEVLTLNKCLFNDTWNEFLRTYPTRRMPKEQ